MTYKPDTSTLRRSIALGIIASLSAQGIAVKAFDSLADLDEVSNLPSFEFFNDPYEVAQDCDALVLVTEWAEIERADLDKVCKSMRRSVFIDTRNLFDPSKMREKGFIYSGIGRGLAGKGESGDSDR